MTDVTKYADDKLFNGQCTFTLPPILNGGAGDLATRWVSDRITQGAFTSGMTKVLTLTPTPPTNALIIGCYIFTTSTSVASNNAATTGLTVEIGVAGDPDSYLTSTSIFGAVGLKQGAHGVAVNTGARLGDTVQAKFTAVGGGSQDVTHITGLSFYVAIFYIPAVTT